MAPFVSANGIGHSSDVRSDRKAHRDRVPTPAGFNRVDRGAELDASPRLARTPPVGVD